MSKCLFAHRVTDQRTGEIRDWSVRKGRWCGECKGITARQAMKIMILEAQLKAIEEGVDDEGA